MEMTAERAHKRNGSSALDRGQLCTLRPRQGPGQGDAPHRWVLNQRSCKFKLSYDARKGAGAEAGLRPRCPPDPCGQSNAPGRGGLGQKPSAGGGRPAGPDRGPSVKGQRWALWGRAAQFPAEDRVQSRGDQAGGGGGNPAKGAEPPDAVGAG